MQNNKLSPQENEVMQNNEHRVSTGLVVTGLVTIVGSWVGMAAFVDYRLDGVEKQMQTDSNEVVTAVSQNVSEDLSGLQKEIGMKVTDTTSVLAKGILDLTNNEEQRYNQILKAINNNGALLEKNRTETASLISRELKESEKEIASLLSQNQTETTKEVKNLLAGIEEKTAQTGREILTVMKSVDQNLDEMGNQLITQLDTSTKTLQDLIEQSNKNESEQLAKMAAVVDSLMKGVETESSKLTTELNTLANRVSTLQTEVNQSQKTVKELNNLVPGWRKTSEVEFAKLDQKTGQIEARIDENLSALQQKIIDLGVAVDNTANNMMKSLYLATEGLEDTKIELKSNLTKSKEETTAELQSLAKTIEGIASSIKTLKEVSAEEAAVTHAFLNPQEIEGIKTQVGTLTSKMDTFHEQISSQIAEARARAKRIIENSEESEQTQVMDDVLQQFSNVTKVAESQLKILKKTLDSLSLVITALGDSPEPEPNVEIGMKVEEQDEGDEISLK